MDRRVLGLVLIAVGVVVALVSGLGDAIGLSFEEGADDELGWIQIVGLVVGVAMALGGLALALTARQNTDGTSRPT